MSEARLESSVRVLVERALQAIERDDPDYGEPLRALSEPPLLACLRADPELGRALFVELRKLRPLSLWARDGADAALAYKRDLSLDGAICTLAEGHALPSAAGRECWLEVDAASAAQTLTMLPRGWGMVVTGELAQVSFASLRRLSPLRALGATLGSPASGPLPADTRLDLVISALHGPLSSPGAHLQGARMLWSVESPEQLRLAPAGVPSAGLLCEGKDACLFALRLASVRLATVPPR